MRQIRAVRDYLDRIGAEPRSIRAAVIRERDGRYWSDIAVIRFGKDGKVSASANYVPTEDEQSRIIAGFATVRFPELNKTATIRNAPPMVSEARPENLFEFRDTDGNIIMLQVRIEKDGKKNYVPWTYWTDGEWRQIEPDDALPLWGIDQLKSFETVFLHEGAKAARAMRTMVEARTPDQKQRLAEHPWGEALSHAAHIGWIGGALSPHRTDWTPIAQFGVKRAYIVNDNDAPGRRAVPLISGALSRWPIVIENIAVTPDKFPTGWDLADPMPTNADGEYIGEPMMSYCVPATFLTQRLPPVGKGKPLTVLRPVAMDLIVPIRDLGCFGYVRTGEIRQEDQLNREQAPYSHVDNSARLFWKDYSHASVATLTYRPDTPSRIVQEGDSRNFNTYSSPPIRARKGDLSQWHGYLDYMFSIPADRHEAERWIATLIGRPDIRIAYALLLISMIQGKGKSTLFDNILRPLVGMANSALVSAKTMDSAFNGWAAAKRLAVCHEIYEAGNWRLADHLKSVLTEERISINEKYQKPYELVNRIVIAAASNSSRALAMSREDRRWLVVGIDETRLWSRETFVEFRRWLRFGGLAAIRYWAENYASEFGGKYIEEGEHAPMTDAKCVAIEESQTPAARAIVMMAEILADWEQPGAIPLDAVRDEARKAMPNCPDSDLALQRLAEQTGLRNSRTQTAGTG